MRKAKIFSMIGAKGASVLVSAVFVILISVVAISLVLTFGTPVLETARDANLLSESQGNMLAIDNAIKQAVSEGAGIVKEARLQISDGTYRVNPEAGSVDFDLAIESDVLPRGFYKKDGNLVTSVTGTASATQNSTHLILRNDVIEVVFQRIGNETSFGSVNTSHILRTIGFRDGSAVISPNETTIKIGNLTSTSWGTGYTKLAFEGSSLPKAEVLAHVRSSQGAEYEVLYTLRGSADFLVVSVLNTSLNRTTLSYAYMIGSNSSDKLRFGDNPNVTIFSLPSQPEPLCFTLNNITRPYVCSYDDSEFGSVKASGILNAGPVGSFLSVCNDRIGSSSGAVYKFNLTALGPLRAVLPFTTGSCDMIGNKSGVVFSQGLPASPFGSYPSGSLSNLQLSLQYENIKLVGDMLLSAGQSRACFKKVGQDGSRIVVNATSC